MSPAAPPQENEHYDWLLVGGGLQNGLITLGILAARPEAKIALIDPKERPGHAHTWCFHKSDLDGPMDSWFEPLVAHRWPTQRVVFPERQRRLTTEYCMVPGAHFAQYLEAKLRNSANARHVKARAVEVDSDRVVLADGRVLTGHIVIDARGPSAPNTGPVTAGTKDCGLRSSVAFQKFFGLELWLSSPISAPQQEPVLMNACVPQKDGFRFFYQLPLGAKRILIEDTYYSEDPKLEPQRLQGDILEYARSQGFTVERILRKESGVLPLPLAPEGVARERRMRSPLKAGYSGGFTHPTTGYSLPFALMLARHISPLVPEQVFDGALVAIERTKVAQRRFCVRLNQLLFWGFEAQDRFRVLERFYGLPQPLIERFYALNTSTWDKIRIVSGLPPPGFSLRRYIRRHQSRSAEIQVVHS